jgi:hypothetical protein
MRPGVGAILLLACLAVTGCTTATSVSARSASLSPATDGQVRGLDLYGVNWNNVTVPGSACFTTGSIKLRHGWADLPGRRSHSSHHLAHHRGIQIEPGVVYGHLQDSGGSDAALTLDCANDVGTADGALLYSIAIYSERGGHLHLLSLLTPQVVTSKGRDVTMIRPKRITHDRVTVSEYFYGPHDETATPTGRATTTWVYRHHRLLPHRPTIIRKPR